MANIKYVYVAESDIPDYVLVGSIRMSRNDDMLKYVPERVCKINWKHIGGDVAAGYCDCGLELDRCHDYEPAHLPKYCPNCGTKVVE